MVVEETEKAGGKEVVVSSVLRCLLLHESVISENA